jgi:hypothetical protein
MASRIARNWRIPTGDKWLLIVSQMEEVTRLYYTRWEHIFRFCYRASKVSAKHYHVSERDATSPRQPLFFCAFLVVLLSLFACHSDERTTE